MKRSKVDFLQILACFSWYTWNAFSNMLLIRGTVIGLVGRKIITPLSRVPACSWKGLSDLFVLMMHNLPASSDDTIPNTYYYTPTAQHSVSAKRYSVYDDSEWDILTADALTDWSQERVEALKEFDQLQFKISIAKWQIRRSEKGLLEYQKLYPEHQQEPALIDNEVNSHTDFDRA